ncbi:thiamine pyrophosphate-dependent dehydrogenase E1 component subunit alpha [Phenylobacterium sp.]|uniref:thiamine pyrophosphate-dependent dehydrogenase E1 component subunit alpha n=1 Tax=Phenylobacterium sp. TaxID=1871053 RepID=UPI002DF28F08|nr:thiamine pyrophosphate-dependent dehydrogenase E1 component subunit alpha [Phenylobacterium sp.]
MAKPADAAPDRDTLLEIYRRTVLINRTDERFRALIKSGQLAIAYYSPRGQEVLSAALMTALRPDDYLVTTYRGVHDQLAKGVPVRELWAEYAGRATGTCKGKGGPMHITHPKTGVMVTTGIVGSGLPIANGLALSSQVRGDGRVTVCCFGDGASNIGAFHESLNMASVWKLPVIFVCQNNGYAESTRYADGTSAATIADRGVSYAMRAVTVDGNDPALMHAAAREAVALARAGEGPTLIEAKTFRFMGHYFGDPSAYIPKAEMEAAVAADPVPAFRARLIELQVSETQLAAMEAAIEAELEAAVAYALESPFPDAAEIRRDVFKAELAA